LIILLLLINTIKFSFNHTCNDTEGADNKQHEKLAVLVGSGRVGCSID
jgi:hypothetical protein